jgi:hypothetical protein
MVSAPAGRHRPIMVCSRARSASERTTMCRLGTPGPPAAAGIPGPHEHETKPHISQVTTDELLGLLCTGSSPGSCPPTGSSRRHDYLHCLAVVPAPPGSRHPGLCLPHRGHLLLQRLYVLCFIQLHTRGVHLAGRTVNPTGDWVAQQARNLLGSLDEEAGFRFLLRDHDSKFTRALDDRWRAVGAEERLHFATRWRRPSLRCNSALTAPDDLTANASEPCPGRRCLDGAGWAW